MNELSHVKKKVLTDRDSTLATEYAQKSAEARIAPIAEAEFHIQEELQKNMTDIALIAGEPRHFTYDTRADYASLSKWDTVDVEYLQTPVYVSEEESSESTEVGYYINSWDGTNHVELRMVVKDRDSQPDTREENDKDIVLASMGGTINCEFLDQETGESISVSGPMFEVSTKPTDHSQPFMKRDDDPVAMKSDSEVFGEIEELLRRMSSYYRSTRPERISPERMAYEIARMDRTA